MLDPRFVTRIALGGTPVASFGASATRDPDAVAVHTWGAVSGALAGQSPSAGSNVCAQTWFRDSPATRSTNLSDAIELRRRP